MPRPNWFLAFPIAGTFVLELPPLPSNFRPFHPEDVHLTLAFLGGCGEPAALRALAALDASLSRSSVSAISASLGSVVPMGGSKTTYSNLSALLEEGRAEASACLAALRDVLTEAATGRRERRPPKPHVSIARVRTRATPSDRQAGLAWAAQLNLRAERAQLDRIALYTWSEKRHDRLFQIVAERRLG